MRTYRQLTIEQRYTIHKLLKSKYSHTFIADLLGVNRSTISREIQRNSGLRGYRWKQAHKEAVRRRKNKNSPRITLKTWEKVDKEIKNDWSPEQISGRLKLKKGQSVSPEWIYQHIYTDKEKGVKLYTHLRCRKKRHKRYGSNQNRGTIPNRTSIDQRPDIVNAKGRIGDWEADTIIGKAHKGALVSLTERKTKMSLIYKVEHKTSKLVAEAMKKLLLPLTDTVHTITSDNGKEFAGHQEISKALKADFYFAHPYASHERGLNENTNGLIRQYFPKDRDFRTITDEEIITAMRKLNNRPRKTLGYLTPNEVFFGYKNVALTT